MTFDEFKSNPNLVNQYYDLTPTSIKQRDSSINKVIVAAQTYNMSCSDKVKLSIPCNPLTLYHGTVKEMDLPIKPISKSFSDFGSGFYTAELKTFAEASSVKENNTNGVLYTLQCNLDNLKVYNFHNNIELWYLFTAVNRTYLDLGKYKKLQEKLNAFNQYDVLVGLIADDRSQRALEDFLDGNITDVCLIESLKYFELGKQYVFKTQRACDSIKIIDIHYNTDDEKSHFKHEVRVRLGKSQAMFENLKAKYFRVGNSVYNILEKYK